MMSHLVSVEKASDGLVQFLTCCEAKWSEVPRENVFNLKLFESGVIEELKNYLRYIVFQTWVENV